MLGRQHARKKLQIAEQPIEVSFRSAAKAQINRGLPCPGDGHDTNRPDVECTPINGIEHRGHGVNRLIDFDIQVTHGSPPMLSLNSNKKPAPLPERVSGSLLPNSFS